MSTSDIEHESILFKIFYILFMTVYYILVFTAFAISVVAISWLIHLGWNLA